MISILMATYNGARFLAEQIDSILGQTIQDFVLYIQDDCSSDKTIDIALSYVNQFSEKIFLLQNQTNSGSAKNNFINMMAKYKDDYIMLCDQDDVWLPNKIEVTLAEMNKMESVYGADTPLLIHTDLQVVDENLHMIHPSVKEYIGTAEINTLRQMILLNNVTGCTALYNHSLAEYLKEIPDYFVMHDWWLAMIAIAFGKMGYVPSATSLYRQHVDNSIGARSIHTLHYKLYKLSHFKEIQNALFNSYRQAKCFLSMFSDNLDEEQRDFLRIFAALPEYRKPKRLYLMYRYKLFRKGLLRKASQIFFG